MAITYSTGIQDKIAFRIYNVAYASLDAAQKEKLDGTTTPPTAPGGAAGEAYTVVQQYGQYFELSGATDAPAEWEPWLVAEAAYQLALTERPDRETDLDQARVRAQQRAMDTMTMISLDDAADTSGYVLNRANIIKSIQIRAVRHKPSFFPQLQSVDEAIHQVIVRLWGANDWSFTRQQVTATLATDGTVTVNMADSEAFEWVVSSKWFYKNTAATSGSFFRTNDGILRWADATEMAELQAAQMTAGKPAHFRILQTGDTKTWILDRTPDAEYTIYGEVKFKQPSLASPANVDAVLGHFPTTFGPTIRDLVWSVVMRDYADPRLARELETKMQNRIDIELVALDDQGKADMPIAVPDDYQDHRQMGHMSNLGGMM